MSRKTMRVRLDQMHSTFDIRVDAKADQSARRAPQQESRQDRNHRSCGDHRQLSDEDTMPPVDEAIG
jgi:hypothetical protein